MHYIDKQGFIDGGYYDNLPISLALKMKAKRVIAIELSRETNHNYYIDRPYIKLIRPSYDLGGFLDFNRDILNWRINLGYYDTLKAFNKLMGYRFTFNNTTLDQTTINKFYWSIINYEDTINKSIITKNIFNSNIPLTDLLKADVYLNKLKIEDYFIRGVEIMMEYFHYESDLIYDFNHVYLEIYKNFSKESELFILYKIKLMQSNIHLKIGYLLY